jgi:hypothetical protein
MELASILLLLVALVAVILFVTRPLAGRQVPADPYDREVSAALAERERLLGALQELDFDHRLGKVPAEDYPTQRALLVQQGAAVLRRLDGLQGPPAAATGDPIEARLAARRAATAGRRGRPSDDDVEDLVTARRTARRDRTAGFCPKCGKPVLLSDQFCPSCGRALK